MEELNTIDYLVDGEIDNVVFLEDICKEFNLNVESYWLREKEPDDWFANGDYIITKEKPFEPERFQHAYSLLIDNNNRNITLFADSIIDGLIQVWGYLELCLKQEIDNKREDTE